MGDGHSTRSGWKSSISSESAAVRAAWSAARLRSGNPPKRGGSIPSAAAARTASSRRLAAYSRAAASPTPSCPVPSVAIQTRIAWARPAFQASVPPAPNDSSSGCAASARMRAPVSSVAE